jgi:hypothetical protein
MSKITLERVGPIVVLTISVVASILMHWNIFNKDITGIHTWRQSQTQLNIQNFYRHDLNILNPRVAHFNGGKDNIHRYEFPIMQWSIALMHKVFGESIIITRICVFIIGVLTLIGFYSLLMAIGFSKIISSLGTFTLCFSPLFYYYTLNPIPDNFALMATTWFLYFFMVSIRHSNSFKYTSIAAIFFALAVLAKLPYVIFGCVIALRYIIVVFRREEKLNNHVKGILVYALTLLLPLLWYSWVIPGWTGNPVLAGIFGGAMDGKSAAFILGYHATTMFPHILLNPGVWVFFLVGLILFVVTKPLGKSITKYILSIVGVLLLYFWFEFYAINDVHDYYMMPFLLVIYIMVTVGVNAMIKYHFDTRYLSIALLISAPFFCFYQTKDYWSPGKSGFNTDLFEYKTALRAVVPNNEKVIMLNDRSLFAFAYAVDKQGYVFDNNHLPIHWVCDLIKNENVNYMYSDSRAIEDSLYKHELVDSLLLQGGSINVLKLKDNCE